MCGYPRSQIYPIPWYSRLSRLYCSAVSFTVVSGLENPSSGPRSRSCMPEVALVDAHAGRHAGDERSQ